MSNDSTRQLVAALDQLGTPRICVVGDLILDRYVWGIAERVSPEAPVPVLRFESEEDRLGGAAAVACLASSLGAQVQCIGVVGNDEAGGSLSSLLSQAGVCSKCVAIETERPTTVKQRFLSRRHGHMQLLRLDREATSPVSKVTEKSLAEILPTVIAHSQVIAISDYCKGVCSESFLQALLKVSRDLGRPTVVDPARGVNYSRYAGATLLAPNRAEMEAATGQRLHSPSDAMEIGVRWARKWNVETLLIKLDQQGLVLCFVDGQAIHFASKVRAVCDITGAGDTVLAVVAMALSSGAPLEIACRLANCAGGLQVERIGVATISRNELRDDLKRDEEGANSRAEGVIVDLAEAMCRSQELRANGQRVIFTNGCFAALHAGHIAYLREASCLGDYLIVAVNSTASIRRLKGERPIIPDADRIRLLAALDFVDCVLLFDEDTPEQLLREIRPTVLVKGGTTDTIVGREIVEAYGGSVVRLGALPGVSTTELTAGLQVSARSCPPATAVNTSGKGPRSTVTDA